MFEEVWEIEYYSTANGKAPYREWVESLSDFQVKYKLTTRLARLRAGNFGQCASVGSGIFELKIDCGPGYRIYFGRAGNRVVLLLCGGNKSTQHKDIQTAQRCWRTYKENKA